MDEEYIHKTSHVDDHIHQHTWRHIIAILLVIIFIIFFIWLLKRSEELNNEEEKQWKKQVKKSKQNDDIPKNLTYQINPTNIELKWTLDSKTKNKIDHYIVYILRSNSVLSTEQDIKQTLNQTLNQTSIDDPILKFVSSSNSISLCDMNKGKYKICVSSVYKVDNVNIESKPGIPIEFEY